MPITYANSKQRKHVPKKEVLKLKPGTFVRIMWIDAPDEVVMILRKPVFEVGDFCLDYMCEDGRIESRATNEQVVEVLPRISWVSDYQEENEMLDEKFHAELIAYRPEDGEEYACVLLS